jgi:anaerobic nitric oxide reductase transcription regulator
LQKMPGHDSTVKLPRAPIVAYPYDTIIAKDLRMRRVLESIKLAAGSYLPVLFSGEVGIGKKLLARELHRLSQRSDKPLFVMDCNKLPRRNFSTCKWRHACDRRNMLA